MTSMHSIDVLFKKTEQYRYGVLENTVTITTKTPKFIQ